MRRTIGRATPLLLLAVGLSGCGPGAPHAVSTAPTTVTTALAPTTAPPTTAPPTTSPPTTAAPTTRPARLSESSRLRIDGIGPVDVGMTVAQARAAAGVELMLTHLPYCDRLTAPGGPAGVDLLVTPPASGRIDLIVVRSAGVATVSGIRVGSTEAEVRAAYPGRLRDANPTMPVHRLIYTAQDPSLADRAVVFVLEGTRVVTIYSGLRNQVEADEICA